MIINTLGKLFPEKWKQNLKIKLGAPHTYWSIANLKRNGLDAKQIVDVGAYKGEFTEAVVKIFPNAKFLLAEANPEHEAHLINFSKKHSAEKMVVNIGLLGSIAGEEKKFHIMDVASSVLEEHHETNSKSILIKTVTLNEVCKHHGFDKVDLIKLDVQGFELEILKGGIDVLNQADAVLMEVSLLDIHKNVPLLRDVVNFMYDYKFVSYDICSVSARRPLDGALWQTDIVFVKENSMFRSDKRYE